MRLAIKEIALASSRKVWSEEAIFNLVHVLHERPGRYSETWDDWNNRTTGGQQYPCAYVGEIANLGNRLWKHKRPENTWTKEWKYVQYISDPKLKNGKFRLLFESFLIYVLKPC